MDDEITTKWWQRLLRLWWLFTVAVVCFLPLVFLQLKTGVEVLLSTLASTALVVWLLAGTVDWWLKNAILKDVFKAAVGYLLPPELKPEMEWVYKQDIIAIKHIQTCKLFPLGDNLVTLKVTVNRTFKNVSQHPAKLKPTLSIDEWFHKGRESKIIEFGCTGKRNNLKYKKGEHSLSVDSTEENEIELAKGDTIDTWFTYEEVKHINDEHTNTFIYPTSSPFVEVEAFEGLKITVGFAMHKQHSLKAVGENRYELIGTLLPGQQINIRWWSIEESVNWQKANEQNNRYD